LSGRPWGDRVTTRVAARVTFRRPAVAGGLRRTGSPRNCWPAGRCQGRPQVCGPPQAPAPCRYAERPVWRSRGAREGLVPMSCLSGQPADGRRRAAGRAVARRQGHLPLRTTSGGVMIGPADSLEASYVRSSAVGVRGKALVTAGRRTTLGHSGFSKISFAPKQLLPTHGDRATWRSIPMLQGAK